MPKKTYINFSYHELERYKKVAEDLGYTGIIGREKDGTGYHLKIYEGENENGEKQL